MSDKRKLLDSLDKYKYPLIILALGVLLMLIPTGGERRAETGDELLRQVLSSASGVGEARVISSESGIVIVCQGAEKAAVRLDIIRAVSSYTGFGSDKITILKMAE